MARSQACWSSEVAVRKPTEDEFVALMTAVRSEWRHCKRMVAKYWGDYKLRKVWADWMARAWAAYRYAVSDLT